MKPPMKQGSPNDFQTPPEALYPLLPFLNKDWSIWECATGEGNLAKELERVGFRVIESDILTGQNFLSWQPDKFDCIITNPPYAIKQDFLVRSYALGKPFALLLPLTTFETAKRQDLFKQYGVQVIFFDKRINFKTPDGKGGGAWFATAWFTWGLKLPHDLNYVNFGHATHTTQMRLSDTHNPQASAGGFTRPEAAKGNITHGYGAGDASANSSGNFPYPQDVSRNTAKAGLELSERSDE